MLNSLKKLKLKLQFTGWLQYLLGIVIASIFFLLSLPYWYFSVKVVSEPLQIVSIIIFLITLFDIVTVKYKLHPKERIPKPLDHLNEFDLMRARVACRSFQNTSLTSKHHENLMQFVQRYNGINPNNFAQNPIRFEYIKAPLTVWPVVGATEFLVAIVPKAYSSSSILDVGRNLQHIVHHATKIGLATCWIGPGADQSSIVENLGKSFDINTEHIVCVCAIGYKSMYKPFGLRLMSLIQHKRLPLDELFFKDKKFNTPIDVNTKPYSTLKRSYEMCQWAPSPFNSQTTLVVVQHDNKQVIQSDFYTTTASKYYAPIALGIWCANWETSTKALDINGHFEVISTLESDDLPSYYVSWVRG